MRFHRRVRPALLNTLQATLLATLLLAAACEKPAPPPPPKPSLPKNVAMVLDGVEIPRDLIEGLVDYVLTYEPTSGRNHATHLVLDEHVIPMVFARHEFKAQRAQLREMADGLSKQLGASGGADELRQLTKGTDRSEVESGLLRPHVGIPEQRWLFADENVGRASPVFELPQGFSVVAATDKEHGLTKAFDKIDAVLVRFFTHKAKAHKKWTKALKERLGRLAKERKKVHPDYRDAIPPWLNEFTIMHPAVRKPQ